MYIIAAYTTPRIWRASDFGGLDLFRATLTEFAFRPHAHEEFFIALTEGGVCQPAYRGGRHVIAAGDLIVLNPEEAHAGGPPPGGSWTYRSLYLRPELFGEVIPCFRADVIRDPEVAGRLGLFHRLSETPGSSALRRESLLAEALAVLAARHAARRTAADRRGRPAGTGRGQPRHGGREPAAVRLSREYLEAHAAENVSLRALAQVTGLSPFHLSRVFAAAVGMPPHAYQTQIRVRRAMALLRSGMPASQAATSAGFYDQAHLTRHFKRIVGLPPGRYVIESGLRP